MRCMKFVGMAMLALAVLGVPVALQSRVRDTPHKLTGTHGITVPNQEVCRPCHTPHNSNTTVGYLWNHQLSTATWTLNAGNPADLSTGSKLCLGCHDGTVALDSYGGATGSVFISGTARLGTDLSGSHPVAVTYPTGTRYNQPDASGNIADPVVTPAGQYAALEDGKVQCGSCHYAHGSRAPYGMFLRVDNTGSQLCMTCHISPG